MSLGFDLSPEQRMLRKTVHDFVERKLPKAFARELEGREEYPAELAKRIAKAGLNGIGIPERLGGEGGDLVDQAIVMEELSRSLAGLGWLWGINVWSGGKAIVNQARRSSRPSCCRGWRRASSSSRSP